MILSIVFISLFSLSSSFSLCNYVHMSSGRNRKTNIIMLYSPPVLSITCEPIIALDIGSTSVKCACFEGTHPIREIPGTGHQVCATETMADGIIDPKTTLRLVDEVLTKSILSLRAKGVKHIKAVGFASLAMNIFGVDEDGEPVTPCYTYASHQPGINRVEDLLKQTLGRADHIRTGTTVHSSYATVQLRALAESGHKYPTLARWQTLSSYVLSRWLGRPYCPISYSEASWMGLLDFRRCCWDERVVSEARVCPDHLPPVVDGRSEPVGYLGNTMETRSEYRGSDNRGDSGGSENMARKRSEEYADLWPEMRLTPLYCGLGDGAAALLGSMCDRPNRVSITVGTSCAARALVPLPRQVSGPSFGTKLKTGSEKSESNLNETDNIIGTDTDPRVRIKGPDVTKDHMGPDPFVDPSPPVDVDVGPNLGGLGAVWASPESALLPTPGLWTYRVDADSVAVGGACTDGGSLIEWLTQLLGGDRSKAARVELERLITRASPADLEVLSRSPVTLPFWSGERSPGWHSTATGTISGLTRSSDATTLLYSLKESIAMRIRAIVLQLADTGIIPAAPDACLVASGKGLARSPTWRQIIADATGYPVVRLQLSGEATPRGVAQMLLNTLEGKPLLRDSNEISFCPDTGSIENNFGYKTEEIQGITYPRPHMVDFYNRRFQQANDLYTSLYGNIK